YEQFQQLDTGSYAYRPSAARGSRRTYIVSLSRRNLRESRLSGSIPSATDESSVEMTRSRCEIRYSARSDDSKAQCPSITRGGFSSHSSLSPCPAQCCG